MFVVLPDPTKVFQCRWLFHLVELYQIIVGINTKEDVS